MTIQLVPVNKENWRTVAKLDINDDQKNFVAPNWYSMLEAIFDNWDASVAFVNDSGEIVGYTMYESHPDEGWGYICRFMIDKSHQRKGYGRAAMRQIIDAMCADGKLNRLKISIVPENIGAKNLYESFGFFHKGEWEDDEMVMEMKVEVQQ